MDFKKYVAFFEKNYVFEINHMIINSLNYFISGTPVFTNFLFIQFDF